MKNSHCTLFMLIACGIFLHSCQKAEPKQSYSFTLEKSIEIPIDTSLRSFFNMIAHSNVVEIDGKEVLFHYRPEHHLICFYDIESGKLTHKIATDEQYLSGIHFQNKDSIFVLYKKFQPVSQLEIKRINIEGDSLHSYIIEHPNRQAEMIESFIEFHPRVPESPANRLQYKNGKFLLTFRPSPYHEKELTQSSNNNAPIIGIYDIHSEELTLSEEYWYPNAGKEINYPTTNAFLSAACFNEKGNPVIRYIHSSMLTEWDIKTDKLSEFQLISPLLDTIMPMDQADSNYPNAFEYHGRYYNLTFDPYREMYYSLFTLSNQKKRGLRHFSICDKDLKNQTEIPVELFNTYDPIFTEDYVIGFGGNKKDTIVLNYYSVQLSEHDQTEEINALRDSAQRMMYHQSAWYNKRFPIRSK